MKLFGYVYKIDKYKKIRVKITDEDKSKQSLETLEEFEQEFVTKVCDIIDSNEDLEFKIPIDSDYKTFVINPKKNTRYRGDNDEYMQKSDLIGQYCKFTVTIKEFYEDLHMSHTSHIFYIYILHLFHNVLIYIFPIYFLNFFLIPL